ncbi:hypothetical protein M436DRAFT_73700 [Aureobasidium namibiae CBS 147.97]|uniref:Uncharacterized protein n=1 Tax=Aureobasidium namibiae CBS 147.97 TaxID=1043004 RepID=A0A074WQH0_9PEZI|nr:uncharacterized protein M436DRAFT_73700 [Aureobasidium namibiae CBS 147.97]KEQ71957.1 hypothetical protein M436DRAFT_73700 [Aureobasidium namibiae CBS 147.97]
MSVSPPVSPIWQPGSFHERQDSVSLDEISHESLKDGSHWSTIDTSYAPYSSRAPLQHDQSSSSADRPSYASTPDPNELNPQAPHRSTWIRCLKDWSVELLCLLLATSTLTLTNTILFLLDNKPLSSWRLSISLNAVISALVVATKAALIYTTACCIGQLKWQHFQHSLRRRYLYDLKTFDEASKGPLGALKLVCRLRNTSWAACLGGTIVAAAVFVEVFGQQVLRFENRRVEVEGAVARFASTQHLAAQDGWYLDYTMMSELQKVMLTAIFRGEATPGFECETAECTWPASATLGICSSCVDVTDISKGSCEGDAKSLDCLFDVPGFGELGGTAQPGGPMPLINTTTIDGVYDVTPSFYNFSTLVVANSTDWTAKLTACELSWCAWTYANASSHGTALDLGAPQQYPLVFTGTWDKTNATSNLDDTQSICVATGNYPAALNNTFTISQSKEYFLKYAVKLILKAGYQGADFYTQLTLATSSLDYADTTAMSSNLAAFMTNALRTQDGMQSIGIAWQSVTFIQVRWAWLTLPAVLVVAAGVLLRMTVLQSQRNNTVLWKTSLLAFLFCSTDVWRTDTSGDGDHARSLEAMELASKNMEVRLERDDHGRYRLVQI